MLLPCGRCPSCKSRRAYEWSVRIMCEAQMHEQNCALTLTYAPEFLPSKGNLCYPDFRNFMKRLRKHFDRPEEIRYFHCGEYGDKMGRPHYHACIFGVDFSEDRYFWTVRDGHRYWKSDTLDRLWGLGNCDIGELTPASAQYVAQYVSKKLYGDKFLRSFHYSGKPEEYATMSRRPGIGKKWFEKYWGDVYPSDQVVSVDGSSSRPPRTFDKYLESSHPELYLKVRSLRLADEDGVVREHDDVDIVGRRYVAAERERISKRHGGLS